MIRTTAPRRSRPEPAPSVRFFGGVPDGPTLAFVEELRAGGMPVRALYRHADTNGDGPAPSIDDAPIDHAGGSPAPGAPAANGHRRSRPTWREWTDTRDAHVVVAGGPASPLDVARRAAAARRTRTLHLWLERPRPGQSGPGLLHRAYLAPWGLDGIFAVGSRSVDTFRALAPDDVPVHVLPRVTDRGAGVRARPATRPTVGYAGPLLPDRGVDLLLRAVARLPASARPRVQVAGTGPEAPALRTRAERLGIDRWIDWLGPVDGDALDTVRARWWAMVVPCQRIAGWGLAVQAALNSGVPVIASRHVLAATDLVRPGSNGLIVRRDDPERWSAAIREMTDPSVRAACSTTARAVGRAFAPRRAARWLLEVLEDAERARGEGRRLESRSFVDHAWDELVPAERERLADGTDGTGGDGGDGG